MKGRVLKNGGMDDGGMDMKREEKGLGNGRGPMFRVRRVVGSNGIRSHFQ